MESILGGVIDGIMGVISTFQENPYQYLYESDIQSHMLTALRGSVSEEITVPGKNREFFTINCVNSEYLRKIDIVCLDPTRGTVPPGNGRYDTHIYQLPILVGIELKYVTMGSQAGFNVLTRDHAKLTSLKEENKVGHSMVLGFVQRDEEGETFLASARDQADLHPVKRVQPDGIYIITEKMLWRANLRC
jgi:hypothetical protein